MLIDAIILDHPRLRGKNLVRQPTNQRQLGSPPLTREERITDDLQDELLGITPAYAGRTTKTFLNKLLLRDHPRLRGKNTSSTFNMSTFKGSPPLTREEQ